MKKKILFMLINMNVGGTEKALLNMISEMKKEQYDITIFMLEKFGGFLESIPNEINVEYLKGYKDIKEVLNVSPQNAAKNLIKQKKAIKAFNILFLHTLSKLLNNRNVLFRYLLKNHPSLLKEYDIAVAYAGPMDFISFFVLNKIKAEKKIQWIHFDVTKIGFNKKYAAKLYRKFDKIFVVSKEGKEKLDNLLPQYKNKTETFNNVIPSQQIIKMAEEGKGFEDGFQCIRILTVGRLSKEKGQDLTINVCEKLKKAGYPVRWYCIGEGSARGEYEELIRKYGLENDYILMGAKSNPYPFIKQCDIYVQSSRYEGYCITLLEAKCLDKPIITTNVNGVNEMFENGETGLIVETDINELFEAIKKVIDSKKLRETFTTNLEKSAQNNMAVTKAL